MISNIDIVLYLSVLIVVIVAAIYDYKYSIIPNKLTFPLISLFLIIRLFYVPEGHVYYLVGLLPAFVFIIITVITNGGVGGGDIKLIAFIGLAVGSHVITIILIAFISALLIGGIQHIYRLMKRREMKEGVIFGPHLAIGYVMYLIIMVTKI